MSKTTKVVLGVVAVLVAGFLGWKALQPQTGGGFAGGITPSQLFSVNSSAGSITPVLSNFNVPGTLAVGGTAANNQITGFYTATAFYPASAVNLGSVAATTSTTSTVVSFSAAGFAVGDACEVSYNGATTTSAFGADAFITAYNTSTAAASATVTFWNGSGSTITLTVTSTFTGTTSTLKTTCFHTGV